MNTSETPHVDRGVVVGVFQDRDDAGRAVAVLGESGIPVKHIGVIVRNGDSVSGTEGSQWEIGAATGAVAGGATGTAIGFAVAAGLVPGIGPVIAGGLLAGICASAAAGAAAGGLLGALIGLGIPEEEAAFYHGEFEAGRTIVTVRAGNQANEVRAVLDRFGGADAFAAGKSADSETTNVGAEHMRSDAARRMNESVERMSSPFMPPTGV